MASGQWLVTSGTGRMEDGKTGRMDGGATVWVKGGFDIMTFLSQSLFVPLFSCSGESRPGDRTYIVSWFHSLAVRDEKDFSWVSRFTQPNLRIVE